MADKKSESDLKRSKPKHPNKKLKFSLPLPPSVNHMYCNTGKGGRRLTKRAEHYIRDTRAIINEVIEDQKWVRQLESTWYYIDAVFYMPDKRIRDSHNMLKILLDVMEGVVYSNDYYAMPRVQSVEYDKENPRVEVCIQAQSKSEREKACILY